MSDAPPPRFYDGVLCLFSGLKFVVSTPSVWLLCAVPALVGVTLSVVLSAVVVSKVPGVIDAWLGGRAGAIGGGFLAIVATLFGVVLSLVVGFSLAQPLSGPALEALVRRQEASLGLSARPATGFVRDVLGALQSLLVGWTMGLPLLAALVVLIWLVPPLVFVLVPLKLALAAWIAAWDLCDYPMSVRGMPVASRLSILFRHREAVLGFGLGMALAGLVPLLGFILLPAAVAGATRLLHRMLPPADLRSSASGQ